MSMVINIYLWIIIAVPSYGICQDVKENSKFTGINIIW